MKKTLLATAIAGAMAASGAQAATVYSQDGTELIVNGRIAMGIRGGGESVDSQNREIDNGPEFVDVFSRLGISMSHDINRDLRAFGRVEWRFTGDERDRDGGFNEVRHSFIGLESASWGTIQAGNYDSFYNTYVAAPFDVYIDRGLELSNGNGGAFQARGDSIGYITPNLSGFQAFLSAKHYSDRGAVEGSVRDDSSEIVTQGGVSYETGALRLALGYVDDEQVEPSLNNADELQYGRGTGEVVYGATAAYGFTDAFSARLGYETQDNNDDGFGGYDTVGLGATYSMGQLAFNADVYRINYDDDRDDRTSWAAGAYYKLSSNFDVFLELAQADQGSINIGGNDNFVDVEEDDDVYWLTGARYHF